MGVVLWARVLVGSAMGGLGLAWESEPCSSRRASSPGMACNGWQSSIAPAATRMFTWPCWSCLPHFILCM